MEGTLAPASRSVIRRLMPWTAALAVFAGGGYGVYSYAVPSSGGQSEQSAATAATAPPSSQANAQIKQLFGAPTSSPPKASYGDRYASAAAPTLPPEQANEKVATPRSAAAVSDAANPFSTTPVGGFSDRYATSIDAPGPATSAPRVEPAEENSSAAPLDPPPAADIATPTADERTDVTRGQEPVGDNPLRAAASRASAPSAPTPGAAEARAVFADAASAPPAKPLDLAAKPRPAGAAPATPPAGATGDSRYAAGASSAGAPPAEINGYSSPLAAAPSTEPAKLTRDDASGLFQPSTPAAAAAATADALAHSLRTAPAPAAAADADAYPTPDPGITPTSGLAAIDGAGVPGERVLEGVQSPALAVQKLAPPEIQIGKKCTFAVRVMNNSQRAAHNVQVRDEVPKGTQLVGAAPRANVNGAQVVWDLGTLSPGEERIVEMELVPTEEGELGSVATVTFASQASAKVRCTRPELALRLTAGPRVMLGQQQLVQIEVSNPGTGDATGVMLLESIPEGVSHEAGPALEYPIGTLRAGEVKRLDLVVTAEAAGKVNNVMIARGDANLEVEANCEFEVIAPALDVSVEGPQKRFLERPATYTVSVNNPGTAAAKDVQLVVKLPPGLQFDKANQYGEYDPATHSVHWSLAELPASESGVVELTALPVEPGDHKLQIATRAQQGLEDSTETHVLVEGLVALSFEATAVDGAIEVGGETTYEITVVNQGSKPATNVQVTAVTPQGIRAAGGQGDSRHVVEGERIVFAPVPQLAPKAEAKFRVKVQGLRAGDQRTRFQVTTDEVREPISKELSTQVYADQ